MQSAEAVLDVIRKRGERGLPVERLYRQLFNPQLYLVAYGRIYANAGAMTPGTTGETADGMSLEKVGSIIDALRAERYRWSPVKRVYIEKKGSTKKRPLGLPTWSDKLVAEVVRLLLEAYYDVQFSDRSHGFRPGRGCHTALSEVVEVWKGTHWFVEGDISDCFGSLDHEVMLSTLAEKIHDGRFLRLISHMLKVGYLEDWRWHATLSGAPQGGWPRRSSRTSTSTGWTSSSNSLCCPSTTRACDGSPTGRIRSSVTRSRRPNGTATGRRCRRFGSSVAPCRARTRTIRTTGDCATSVTPTTGSWGSPAPSTKPRRSRRGSVSSCATSSGWNSPSPRP